MGQLIRRKFDGLDELGKDSRSFAAQLLDIDPSISDDLQIIQDEAGRRLGLHFSRSSSRMSSDFSLTATILEQGSDFSVEFCAHRNDFRNPEDAISFIEDVLSDRIVLVEHFRSRQFVQSWVFPLDQAKDFVADKRTGPQGCLDIFSQSRQGEFHIKSWTRSEDELDGSDSYIPSG